MKNKKYISSGGLAFEEEKDMRKLEKYAAEGWKVEGFYLLGYKLKKSEPAEKIYAIDYCNKPDEEYFSYFREGGWEYVASQSDYIHLFTAAHGTTPLYTDKATEIDKYEAEQRMTGKAALPMLIIEMLLLTGAFGDFSFIAPFMSKVFLALCFILSVPLVFTGLPWFGYTYRLFKLRHSR
ncbi:DUF2812 domain-containing protein [Salimicrobium humidisoli]|uniref:DUF2812 domain-containing protein n=1 Tax=Salimicrobium humidisoli TaxID=2029857 RepID=A0ABX4HU29_9BACI|nr:DUF2812 domain-containing protein [Salimicrobium humidisoli]PBB06553.1 hypothetical protein CKW00_02580 [Salimicrobium humidisoli]